MKFTVTSKSKHIYETERADLAVELIKTARRAGARGWYITAAFFTKWGSGGVFIVTHEHDLNYLVKLQREGAFA